MELIKGSSVLMLLVMLCRKNYMELELELELRARAFPFL